MRFIFWNIRKNPATFTMLKNIVMEEDVDVVALSEFPNGQGKACEAILKGVSPHFTTLNILPNHKVELFYRTDRATLTDGGNTGKQNVVKIQNVNGGIEVHAFFVHLESKLNGNTPANQASDARKLVNEIVQYETNRSKVNHTLVCGDFNMNPFEDGMKSADALCALMDRNTINRRKGQWTIDSISYKFFYNPMWSCFGDISVGNAPGTYLSDGKYIDDILWHMFDQVLIRPELIDKFDNGELKIITKGNTYNLMKGSGKINTKISDHLPIKFKLII